MTNATPLPAADPVPARSTEQQLARLCRHDKVILAGLMALLAIMYLVLLGGVACVCWELMKNDGVMGLAVCAATGGTWTGILQTSKWIRNWRAHSTLP